MAVVLNIHHANKKAKYKERPGGPIALQSLDKSGRLSFC